MEMLLEALPHGISTHVVMKCELAPWDSLMFKCIKLWIDVLQKYVTMGICKLLDLEGSLMLPRDTPDSVSAGVPLLLMAVVLNPPAIPSKEILAPPTVREENSIT